MASRNSKRTANQVGTSIVGLCRWLRLEDLVALGKGHPRLPAAGPDMSRRPYPGRVVERARPNPKQAVPGRAANPGAAVGTHPSRVGPSAIGEALERARCDTAKLKPALRDHDAQRKGAARQTLAVLAVAGVDQLRGLGDPVAELAALAAAGLGKFHGDLPSPRYYRSRYGWPQRSS